MNTHNVSPLACALKAKSIAEHDRTVAVLMDDRPGLEKAAARAVSAVLMENGYLVHEITVREFCEKTLATLGFALLIPHAVSVPAICAEPLRKYSQQGGHVLTLGGPLFADLIEETDGAWRKIPLDDQVLDATFSGRMTPFVMEGIAPTYKIYFVEGAVRFQVESDQPFVHTALSPNEPERIVCPSARPHGLGYNMDRRNRFIPLVQAMGEGGRAEGRRGAAAFFMLSDTRCHLPVTNGNRPGSVSATTVGSAVASIGLTRQDILSVPGAEALLLSMLTALRRGLFLFEGGADCFTCHAGDSARLGAKILNTSQDFKAVSVRVTVCADGARQVFEAETLAMPRNMTTVEFPWSPVTSGVYTAKVELIGQGTVIDTIEHEVQVPAARVAAPSEFVTVQDGEFFLNGKPWPAFGINYWPHYYPGFEREDYWLGWLDKSNYDPLEVERDLIHMEKMGYTCLFTRIDGNIFERTVPQLKDFMLRLARHGMKLSLSYCNATCPVNYQPLAFRKLMDAAELHGNPTLFGHDIAWEIGTQFYAPNYTPQWDDRWADWINDRYGGIENAERDWGVPAPRDEAGRLIAPPYREFIDDGAWRVRSAAYRRFLDDMISRMWNDAVSDMRSVDPAHIISYRLGPVSHASAALTATNKHIDYASPEGYSVQFSQDGEDSACCLTLLIDMLTGGKPVVWSEFGMSLTDVRWRSLIWDSENFRPYPHKIREQADYMALFARMFKETGVRGSAPWWYAGGFRMVEMSDFGLIGPDGTERPAARDYAALRAWFDAPRDKRPADTVVTVDPDAHAGGFGHIFIGDNIHNPVRKKESGALQGEPALGQGLLAVREARAQGKRAQFRTPGMGTTSANAPLLAVGNTPYTGNNPPKYLNAEFNAVTLILPDGTEKRVLPGEQVQVPQGAALSLSAGVGNLREAMWLAPKGAGNPGQPGAVYLASTSASGIAVKAPIAQDTPYLGDADITPFRLTGGITEDTAVSLRMEAEGRMAFGEIFRFTLVPIRPKNLSANNPS